MSLSISERARRYVMAMPPSISPGGSTPFFAVALALIKGFNLSEQEATGIIREFNETRCDPKWSDVEIVHKLADAKNSSKPQGYLLKSGATQSPVRSAAPYAPSPPSPKAYSKKDLEERAAKREGWKFQFLNEEQMYDVADLRRLPIKGITEASRLEYLKFGYVRDEDGDHASFIIRNRVFAQARRMDGLKYNLKQDLTKAKTLPGSIGSGFIGQSALGVDKPVLVVEGAIGYVEALAAASLAGEMASQHTVLAAIAAGSRFINDDGLLEAMAGRRVRIIQDNDEAGKSAAEKWAGELRSRNAVVDIVGFPAPCKDLGEYIAGYPKGMTQTLQHLFSF